MPNKRYLFNAPEHHELRVGKEVHHGGDTVELDPKQAVDERLVEVKSKAEAERIAEHPAEVTELRSSGEKAGGKGPA